MRILKYDNYYQLLLTIHHLSSNFGLSLSNSISLCLPASQLTRPTIQSYEQRTRQWGRDFIDVYHSDEVTPYIHAMMKHVGEFMRIHGSIILFTQQGLEKHDIMTKIYFRASHRGVQALCPSSSGGEEKSYYLTDNDCMRAERVDITCSNCDETGHNGLSCSKPCKMCGEHYSQHFSHRALGS